MVFGEPALATAIDLRTKATLSPSKRWRVNHGPISNPRQKYVKAAVEISKMAGPMDVEIESQIPEGSGMGSSAAVTVAVLGALNSVKDDFKAETVAIEAFDVEHTVQGRASPIDTSTSAHGRAVLVLRRKDSRFLWQINRGDRSWFLHHRDIPQMHLVVGYTGIVGETGPLVAKVKEYAEKSKKARDMISEIGQITIAALEAIGEENYERVGSLMTRNHILLNALGVGHPFLDALVKAVEPYSWGAKLTGAGGGGSMIALTERPAETAKAIEAAGGKAFKVRVGARGMEVMR